KAELEAAGQAHAEHQRAVRHERVLFDPADQKDPFHDEPRSAWARAGLALEVPAELRHRRAVRRERPTDARAAQLVLIHTLAAIDSCRAAHRLLRTPGRV